MLPYSRLLWTNTADHTPLASFTSEASALGGTNLQPALDARVLDGSDKAGKAFVFEASGTLGSTGAPTFLFTARLGTTVAAITDAVLAKSAAITLAGAASPRRWRLWLKFVPRTLGQGAGNTTFSVDGFVESNGGFASPYKYALSPGGGESATWTVAPANFDAKAINYLNLSVTCSASDAANVLTVKQASLWEMG